MCSIKHCNKRSVNKKYDLCDDHNYVRLNGKTKQQAFQEKVQTRVKAIYTPSRKTYRPPRQQRPEETLIKQKLSALKTEIEMDAIHSNEYYCKGCGKSHPGLDKSHILSVGQFKHLELMKANIQLLCRDCHMAWESWDIEKMAELNCFEENLDFVRVYSREFYSKIWHLMREVWKLEPTTNALKKIQNILKKVGEKVAR